MKKTFALLLALVMALALVACGQKEDNIGGETKDDQTQTDGQSVDLRAEYEARHQAGAGGAGRQRARAAGGDGCGDPEQLLPRS